MSGYQYYVPRFLLSKFSSEKTKKLTVYSKNKSSCLKEEKHPKEVMGAENFYQHRYDKSTDYDQVNTSIEGHPLLHSAFDKIKDRKIPIGEERDIFLKFINTLCTRTPMAKLCLGFGTYMMWKRFIPDEKLCELVKSTGKETNIKESQIDYDNCTIVVDDKIFVKRMTEGCVDDIELALFKIAILNNPSKISNIISDNPVIKVFMNDKNPRDFALLCPINKRKTVLLYKCLFDEFFAELPYNVVAQLNEAQIANADDLIVGNCKDNNVLKQVRDNSRHVVIGPFSFKFKFPCDVKNFKSQLVYQDDKPVRDWLKTTPAEDISVDSELNRRLREIVNNIIDRKY